MYQSILVAFDMAHKERGVEILHRARDLSGHGGTIKVIYVLEDLPAFLEGHVPTDIIDENAEAIDRELHGIVAKEGVEAHVLVRKGSAHRQILFAAEDMNADLIVIASHNPGLQDFFIGSTASKVVRSAQCAVLVDRPTKHKR